MTEFPTPRHDLPYFYLWHLVSLGVIEIDQDIEIPAIAPCPTIKDSIWDRLKNQPDPGRPAKIAMIDVGCSLDHPNLAGRVDPALSIDLAAHQYGAKIQPRDTGTKSAEGRTYTQFFKNLDIGNLPLDGLEDTERSFLQGFVEDLTGSSGIVREFGDVENMFSSHGTAIGGLIVAGPAGNQSDSAADNPDALIPYFGVDPFSHLFSIRTSFDNDPAQIIAAFLYAWMHHADVIVLPRGVPDPLESPVQAKNDLLGSLEYWKNRDRSDLFERIEKLDTLAGPHDPQAPYLDSTNARLWRIVRYLIVEISKQIPIVCAAGNEGESQLIYPARLADRENGIIAVGAVTSEGYRSGYSNYGDGLTLVAPSDDMEIHNRFQVRTNWAEYQARKDQFPIPANAMITPYSSLALLTTDLPGSFGYDGSIPPGFKYRNAADGSENTGYYTSFGGTSGACALVAGVIALIRRAESTAGPTANFRDGRDIKELLRSTAKLNTPVLPGGQSLRTDRMNSPDEDAHPPEYFFGAGLADATAAVDIALGEEPG